MVSGIVTDKSGQPLPGVTVVLQGTTRGTVTNADGNYSLTNIPEDAILVFSFVGMRTQEIPVGNLSTINVEMVFDAIGIEEVVAIGYGTVKKSDLTGSVAHIDASQFFTKQATNAIEFLSGTIAGFNSTQGASASGGGSMEVRGPTSLAANNNPLIVLDGVIYFGSISDINPNDIESIDVLKDASSAAVYGARAASGVVIITTKTGKEGAPIINFSTQIGVTALTNSNLKFQSPEKFMRVRQTGKDRAYHYYTNPNNLPSEISLEEWKNYDSNPSDDITDMYLNRLGIVELEKENYRTGKTIDWYDEIMRNGIRQNYDLSLSGKNERLSYYWSLGYTDNEGIELGDDFNTVRSRLNLNANVNKFIKVGANIQFSDRDESSVPTVMEYAKRASPYGNMYNDDGTVKWYPHDDNIAPNPFLNYYYQDRLSTDQSLFANLSGELKLLWGFSYKIAFVNRYLWSNDFNYYPTTTIIGYQDGGRGTRARSSRYEWMIDNLLSWKKTVGAHNFDLTLLYNAEKNQAWSDNMVNTLFSPSEALSFHQLEAGANPLISNNDIYSTGNATMARLNYTLLNRYLITASWRRDGYSAFGINNKYATFPAVALAWKISDENFFNNHIINLLKIRTSWGINGNRDIGIYDALAKLATTKYLYGTTPATGIYSNTMANSDLRWERTESINFGLDFGILNNRVQGSADYYRMTTNDLLLDRSLPEIIGYASVTSNLGELFNQGFEFTLNTVNIEKNKNFRWNSSLVFSFNRNKIKHLYGEMIDVLDKEGNVVGQKEADDWTNGWFIGESIDRIWNYKFLGVWQEDEAEQAAVYGQFPGDPKLQDTNPDDALTNEDKVFLEYKKPRYRFGFRNDFAILKNLKVSAFIRAELGHFGANGLYRRINQEHRLNDYDVPYWTKENPSNKYVRIAHLSPVPFSYFESRAFVRLQDLSVSYIMPGKMVQSTPIKNLTIYLSGRNLVTLTKWTNWDPETGGTPLPKFYSLGLNLTL
jgi:TonB-linked SusC/RagA family outer membrane protein